MTPPPGTVLVADELRGLPGAPLACPAAALVDGELRRQGIPTARGPVDVVLSGVDTETTWTTFGGVALAVSVRVADTEARLAAKSTVGAWLAAGGPRTVVLAAPRSFCAGVERAVQVVERELVREPRVYVRKQIVHNTHVVADLESRGAVFVDELAEVPPSSTVVFSAHGVSPAVRSDADARSLRVIDATCPLVTKVHAEARRFAARGDTVILIGHAGHEEVDGTLGEVPDMRLVQSVADVSAVAVPDPTRVSYLTQTTLAVDETVSIIDALRARFPALRGPGSDDICYATTNRQNALRGVADRTELVLVVGSSNSSNSQRLVELASRQGTPAYLIEDVGSIRPQWLMGVRAVGLTAGASAPPRLVDEVVAALGGLGAVSVEEHETTRETIEFTLPSAVRGS
ncbi:4-hydroxy-3-methylbut-2-enyl diphosphate reductase [Actinokineospora enzanensis]|uniref:4-hydroxy-3-methylbut-2-enyl diphosphate reductase n=1 Tax=Actinokineospora enzanensis TaxID=155975 RepID=UPI000363E75F|nr:4-hydroxy-3-methylbut-2-enyl diphosphate reductase [Actinokineospora enzanensis]